MLLHNAGLRREVIFLDLQRDRAPRLAGAPFDPYHASVATNIHVITQGNGGRHL